MGFNLFGSGNGLRNGPATSARTPTDGSVVGTAAPKPGDDKTLSPPPPTPQTTLISDSANTAAAKLAADIQRRKALAGSGIGSSVPRTNVTPPTAGGAAQTLIGS